MALTSQAAARKDQRSAYSKMQHRHFTTVAAIVDSLPLVDTDRRTVAEHFATELAKTNPRFDRERFIAACLAS